MKQKDLSKPAAKKVAQVLNSFLRSDANSASCAVFYQPKAPKELERFKKKR
ncbi:MAG: cyclic lactone autoinducer peptide [Lachnospiraceae bacterium]|nr:cyclic lactone autoinducer peptide [Lachnospiraceae bacterium]MCI8780972.1 cyclic lactone autoinducer peptide [Lachnospiraceae bacterium]